MCERADQLHAYYDDELTPARRAEFESHLASCDECGRLLGELKQTSNMLRTASLPAMPVDLPVRLVAAWQAARRAQDDGLRKLAGWMTAAAAIVLVAAMLRVSGIAPRGTDSKTISEASTGSRDWELAAVMPPDRAGEDAGSADLIQLAQWMARDLSPDERR